MQKYSLSMLEPIFLPSKFYEWIIFLWLMNKIILPLLLLYKLLLQRITYFCFSYFQGLL